jgi:hypothetical protein
MDDRVRVEHRGPWVPWAVTSLALVAVAALAYGLGAQRDAGALGVEPARWRGGFGGIWVFFLLFWIFGGLRSMWWGGGHHTWRYGGHHPRYDDERDQWEEWHRREHDRMNGPVGPRPPSSQGSDQRPIT